VSPPLNDNFPPSVIIGIAVLVGAYLLAGRILLCSPTRAQVGAFSGAMFLIWFALGPLDALADRHFFTMHMLEHSVLTFGIPPLLLLGVPDWMLRPWVLSRWLRPLARFFTNPLIAFSLVNVLLAVVHVPSVFDLMIRDQPVHIAVHLLFMITGTLMWWPLLSPTPELPRMSYPAQIFYLFVLLIPMAAVAAPITLASNLVFKFYREGPNPWGLTPLADQVCGGILMWVGDGFYVMLVFSWIFFQWASRDDRDEPPMRQTLRLVTPSLRPEK
jgi:putative membrane protein